MSLNLWKVAGKPVAYSPLPLGQNALNLQGLKEYQITFKAKSASAASLLISNWFTQMTINQTITLTPEFKTYTFTFNQPVTQNFNFQDSNNRGDIIIDSIELVQKPLAKLTINGIDSFGPKWTLHANATVIDGETLELNATGINQGTSIKIDVLQNTVYSLNVSVLDGGKFCVTDASNTNFITGTNLSTTPITFNTLGNKQILIWLQNTTTTGKFTFKRPMLNLGSIPAPYEKKRGEKMVQPVAKKNLFDGVLESGNITTDTGANEPTAGFVRSKNYLPVRPSKTYTFSKVRYYHFYDVNRNWISSSVLQNETIPITLTTPSNCYYIRFHIAGTDITEKIQLEEGQTPTTYTPYAVQVNAKPKRYVAKKNLYNGGNWKVPSASQSTIFYNQKHASPLMVSFKAKSISNSPFQILAQNVAFSSVFNLTSEFKIYTCSFSNLTDGLYFFNTNLVNDIEVIDIQIEPGTTATAYEPYTPILPRAKTGLSFNGVTDYFQLPSMTMDSVEIDCNLDNAVGVLLDARGGLANSYIYSRGTKENDWLSSVWSNVTVNGVLLNTNMPLNQRIKIKATAISPFTDNVNIFARFDLFAGLFQKGTLYKVTCYLAGAEVARYNFENVNNIVGDKLIPQAVNLIPSFEDARWSLHANAKVLGKDVLKMDASVAWNERNSITLFVPQGDYFYTCSTKGGFFARYDNLVGQSIGSAITGGLKLSIPSGGKNVYLSLECPTVGSFDFIKPQLFQLDGKEGSIVGTPTKLRKASKRTMYAKR